MRNEEKEELDNVIMFPVREAREAEAVVRKDLHDMLPRGWHRIHFVLAPHITHIIIIGACALVLVGATAVGVHEGIVHHVAIAVIAERIATMGVTRKE